MVLIDMDRLRKELMAKGDIPIHEVFNTIWEQPIVNVSQQKWIPVSERLPEVDQEVKAFYIGHFKTSQRVLITKKNGVYPHMGYFQIDMNKDGRLDFIDMVDCCHIFISDIIAWMPVPEPYKEDNNAERDA